MTKKISQLAAAASLAGTELIEISKLSTTVTKTGTTISALASDNSINDSGAGWIAAGFAVGDQVRIQGFTGNVANNIFSARITAITTAKITIGGTDGDVIVDDAAGESVTVTKWESVRATSAQLSGSASARLFPVAIGDETTPLTAGAAKVQFHWPCTGTLNEIWAGVRTVQTSGSILTFDVNDGGSTMLSTKITIDNNEDTSLTAAAQPVLSDTAVTKGGSVTIDIDQVGAATAAAGAKLYFSITPSP